MLNQVKIAILVMLIFGASSNDEFEAAEQEFNGESDQGSPQIDEMQKMNFLKSFVCIIGTDRHLQSRQHAIMSHSSRPNFKDRFERLTANVFRTCLETIDENTMSAFLGAKSKEDVDSVVFEGLEQFRDDVILENDLYEMSEEEQMIFKNYEAIKKDIEKMQKEQKENNRKEGVDSGLDEEDNVENLKNSENLQIVGLTFKGTGLKLAVFLILSFFSAIVYFLWRSLFKEPVANPSKKQQKKQKKKAD